MDPESIYGLADSGHIRLARFLFTDSANIIRAKAASASTWKMRFAAGIGLVKGTMAMNMMDELQADTGYGATGEIRLVPDLSTFKVVPYAPATAVVLCDMVDLDHSPWALCPRSILKRQLDIYKEVGIRFEAAFEPEFFLARKEGDRLIPIDESNCFSTDGMNKAANFIDDFVQALQGQDISVEQYYAELGHGQHELSIRHAPALQAADNHILYRETLRGVANQHNLIASLAPKPGVEMPGNGCHLHLSAWDTDTNTNLFWSDNGLSDLGKFFVAGVLRHLPAIVAVTCPSVNSYRRLKPKSWSSAFTCWGYENREAAVRVPSLYWDHELESANIEVKCVDSSANPYLALAVLIAAGMDGVKKKMNPPEPVQADPSTISSTEAAEKKVERLPISLKDATKKLLMDATIMEALGDEFARVYLKVKSSEDAYFAKLTPEDEIKAHLTKF
jgi:glutamine synthetase